VRPCFVLKKYCPRCWHHFDTPTLSGAVSSYMKLHTLYSLLCISKAKSVMVTATNTVEPHSVFHCQGQKGCLIVSGLWCYLFHGNNWWDSILLIYWEVENLEKENMLKSVLAVHVWSKCKANFNNEHRFHLLRTHVCTLDAEILLVQLVNIWVTH